jgi:hypothetical protein
MKKRKYETQRGSGLDDKLEKSETRYQDLDRDISNGNIYIYKLEGSIKGYYECPSRLL